MVPNRSLRTLIAAAIATSLIVAGAVAYSNSSPVRPTTTAPVVASPAGAPAGPAGTATRASSSRSGGFARTIGTTGHEGGSASTNPASKKPDTHASANPHLAKKAQSGIDIAGRYASDVLCAVPEDVQPGPGTPPDYVDITCVGGTVYAGDLTGHTIYNVPFREYVNGDARATAPFPEWFYGRLASDGSTGGLHFDQQIAIYTAATDTFHVEGVIVGGTCDFTGASGWMRYDGDLIQGTWSGHLVRPTVRPSSPSPCNPLGPLPPSPDSSTSSGHYATSVQGGWIQPGCAFTSAAPAANGSTHVEGTCTLTSTGTWAGQEVEHVQGDIAPDLQITGTNDYDLYGRDATDNTCGSIRVHEILSVDGATGALFGLDTIISGTGDWAGSSGQFVVDGSVFGGPGFGGYHGTWIRPGTPKPPTNIPCVPSPAQAT